MLTSRQEKILEKIVYRYVQDVKPVSSKEICDELKCSSATVRNEMAALEDLGYLEKNHISSPLLFEYKGGGIILIAITFFHGLNPLFYETPQHSPLNL